MNVCLPQKHTLRVEYERVGYSFEWCLVGGGWECGFPVWTSAWGWMVGGWGPSLKWCMGSGGWEDGSFSRNGAFGWRGGGWKRWGPHLNGAYGVEGRTIVSLLGMMHGGEWWMGA